MPTSSSTSHLLWLLATVWLGCVREQGPQAEGPPPLPPPTVAARHESSAPARPLELPAGDAQPATERVVRVLHGKASYYSSRLAGRKTASGQPYDPELLTAAHRSLPFGTRVRVVREDTGHAVTVTINDRGPFAGQDRIIDVSGRAAHMLEMHRAGVVSVRVEVLEVAGVP